MARRTAAPTIRLAPVGALGVPDSLRGLAVHIDSLRPYAANPRNGDIEAIKESLRYHGQYRPIVVRQATNEILAGNHTYMAAMELGWKEIAATFVDCDDEQAARIVVVDNRLNDRARYDQGLLATLLQGLDTLDGTGYDDGDLAKLLADDGGGNTAPQMADLEYRLIVACNSEDHQAELLRRFEEEGLQVKALIS
jgi:hypothetical protein